MFDKEFDSLEAAQQRKLEYYIQQGVSWRCWPRPRCRMWMMRVAEAAGNRTHQVKLAIGLTLSENQAQWICEMGLTGVEARVES
jgi:hypothetical protein